MLLKVHNKLLFFINCIKLTLVILFFQFILNLFNIGCPVKTLLNIECPTCDMTHALKAILRRDIIAYRNYNVMAIPILIALFLGINLYLFNNKKIKNCITFLIILISIVNFIYYIIIHY